MRRTETRLDDESRRAEAYLRPATHAKVQRVCDDELLADSKVQTVMLQRADGSDDGAGGTTSSVCDHLFRSLFPYRASGA